MKQNNSVSDICRCTEETILYLFGTSPNKMNGTNKIKEEINKDDFGLSNLFVVVAVRPET